MPKKRLFNGVELEPRLYGNKARPTFWRIKLPDDSFRSFRADDAETANEIARQVFAHPELIPEKKQPTKSVAQWHLYAARYKEHRERLDPTLAEQAKNKKGRWNSYQSAIDKFCTHFAEIKLSQLELSKHLKPWWETLGFEQQKTSKAALRPFFNDLMTDDLLPKIQENPFPSARAPNFGKVLVLKPKPKKITPRMEKETFSKIYTLAKERKLMFVCLSMDIGLYTGLRPEDIVELRFDKNINNNLLQLSTSKSIAQRGEDCAVNLEWNLNEHKELSRFINLARQEALINNACPYVISHNFQSIRKSENKTHKNQVLRGYLGDKFKDIRDELFKRGELSESQHKVPFREIRPMAGRNKVDEGFSVEDIAKLLGHRDLNFTKDTYLSGPRKIYEAIPTSPIR